MQNVSDTGVLLIHGFLGAPYEWDVLENKLQARGYRTLAITQPGHGHNPSLHITNVTAEVILQHSASEYETFADQCKRVYVVGHSLGGLCALWLAASNPEKLSGAMVFSAPYQHAYWINHFSGLLRFPATHLKEALSFAPEFMTGYVRPTFLPWHLPLLQSRTLSILQQIQDCLPEIDIPLLLAHSPYDLAIPYTEMEKIAARINKPYQVRMHTLSQCGHQVFLSHRNYEEPYQLVLNFLQEREAGWSAVDVSGEYLHKSMLQLH
jgi:carboxylesterase